MRAVPENNKRAWNKGGHMRAVGLLCSPNARPEKGLVQALNWRPISPHPPRTEQASLEGTFKPAIGDQSAHPPRTELACADLSALSR